MLRYKRRQSRGIFFTHTRVFTVTIKPGSQDVGFDFASQETIIHQIKWSKTTLRFVFSAAVNVIIVNRMYKQALYVELTDVA